MSMGKLAPVLGSHITDLVVNYTKALDYLKHFPHLKRLQVTPDKWCHAGDINESMVCALIQHPQLVHLNTSSIHIGFKPGDNIKQCRWSTLHVANPDMATLAHAPLHGLDCLCIERGMRYSLANQAIAEQAVANLSKVQNIEWIPHKEEAFSRHVFPPDMLVWVLEYFLYAPMVALCTQHLLGAVHLQFIWFDQSQLPALQVLPRGVSALRLVSCEVHDGLCWTHVWQHLPSHLEHVVVAECDVRRQDVLDLIRHAAPNLCRVTVCISYDLSMQQADLEEATAKNISLRIID